MIRLENVSRVYRQGLPGEVVALEAVSLEVAPGELVVLRGPSGSGKSTLLSIVGGLNRPTSGRVEVAGVSVAKLPDAHAARFRREKVGFVFQRFHLVPEMSALENVALPLLREAGPWARDRRRAEEALARFGMGPRRDAPVRELSAGEQQRVAIARALVADPPLVLADEPTANLDAKLAAELLRLLGELKRAGKTVLVATHDPLFDALPERDREVRLAHGRMVA